ncbi:MAG: DUF4907 domain-containing protein [Flavobacteriales bacterium]|nr:DUF4907 domain-containing protein [Flavobacteriales bacterium]
MESRNADHAMQSMRLEVSTYRNDSIVKGWGYDIYADDALYIHQPTIPAIQGTKGFHSEQDARAAGNFTVHKIKKNIVPPTISVAELDSLGLLR